MKAGPMVSHALCRACDAWLGAIVSDVRRDGSAGPGVVGAPVAGGRSLLFGDQCHLCREVVHGAGVVIEYSAQIVGPSPWRPMFVCAACDGWLSSLAKDGRSARGDAQRSLDGAYGEWLHPNLRGLIVAAAIADESTRQVVVSGCAAMGVILVDPSSPAPVLIVDARRPDRAASLLRADQFPREARIVLAPVSAKPDLMLSIAAAATDWLTVPLTPQQLTAALVRSRRKLLQLRIWDEASCLPQVYLEGNERPVLRIDAIPGADPFALAWTLRRFARGYDEVGSYQGAIVLVLRAATRDVDAVVQRLGHVLGGSARVTPLIAPSTAVQRPRFEAAG